MATFGVLAAKCASSVAVELLAAIATVESGGQPFAVRDGVSVVVGRSALDAVGLAAGAMDRGQDVGLGLMGLTASQLSAGGVSVAESFEACASMRAAERLYLSAADAAQKRGLVGAAIERQAIRAWWHAGSRFRSAELFEVAVREVRAKPNPLVDRVVGVLPLVAKDVPKETAAKPAAVASAQGTAVQRLVVVPSARVATHGGEQEPPCWDVFARARFGRQCEESAAEVVTFSAPAASNGSTRR